MQASTTYNGNFDFDIVDSFLEANEPLTVEAESEISYDGDVIGYLNVTSAVHNGSSCFVGTPD